MSLGTVTRRLAGMLVDGMVLAPVLVVSIITQQPHFVQRVDPATGASRLRLVASHPSVLVSLLLLLPGAAYTIILVASRGQTLGEMAMKLRVVRLADGQVPG